MNGYESRDEKERDEKIREQSTTKLTKFISEPRGIPDDFPGVILPQADLSSPDMLRTIIYHLAIADRIYPPKENNGKITENTSNPIARFAKFLALGTWPIQRKSREEAVISIRGLKPEKMPLHIESLESYLTPEKEREKVGLR